MRGRSMQACLGVVQGLQGECRVRATMGCKGCSGLQGLQGL